MVDRDDVMHVSKFEGLPEGVPLTMINKALKYVHGSTLSGHYRKQRTILRLKSRFWQ